MTYDFIIIDSITCESFVEVLHYGENADSESLWDLQTKSGNRIANEEEGLLIITPYTKELIEKKYSSNGLPMSLSCLLSACEEIDIASVGETQSILKAASLLTWKKKSVCILTGNSLLRSRLNTYGFDTYDLSQVKELSGKV